MRKKIGIGILFLLNISYTSFMIFGARLGFGLIVADLGQDLGKEVASQVTFETLMQFTVVALLVFLINYFLLKKMVLNSRPLIVSVIISFIGVIVFIPFLLSAKQSFINYQNGTTKLTHYLEKDKITEALIVFETDSVKVKQLDEFVREIGYAKYKRGIWKYNKKMRIILKRTDGNKDTIATNGLMFGPYKGKFFATKKNVVEKYLTK